MGAEPRRRLADAAAQRTLDAEQRVRGALRAQIEALRVAQAGAPGPLAVRHRASDASLSARLRAALDESQRLREESARLRDELALSHGRVREFELDRRARRT